MRIEFHDDGHDELKCVNVCVDGQDLAVFRPWIANATIVRGAETAFVLSGSLVGNAIRDRGNEVLSGGVSRDD